MLASERYLYVLFCCQQTIEKALKAVIVQRTAELPPRLHNLLKLAEAAQIELDPEQTVFLAELNGYYIKTRYPEEIGLLGKRVTREMAQETLRQTEENTQCLLSKLK